MPAPDRRWLTPLSAGLLGLTTVLGLVSFVKGAFANFIIEPTHQADFGGYAGAPLAGYGASAVVVSVLGIVLVLSIGRRSPKVQAGLLMASLGIAVALLVGGEVTHLSRADPWPGYHRALAQLRAPAAWKPAGELDQGRGGFLVTSDPPGSSLYWDAPGLGAVTVCAQLRAALAGWSGTTQISVYPSLGLDCQLNAQHDGLGVFAFVGPTLAKIGKDRLIPVPSGPAAAGPAVAVQLYYNK